MKRGDSFTFIDLFAGIGGFHIALHELGGKCVFASEIDKFARKTYETNFHKLSPELFRNGRFNDDITDENLDYASIPDFDVLCAGFPCQPFSNAGLKRGFDDTRGTLFFNIKAIVSAKKNQILHRERSRAPRVLLLENVKGFKSHDRGRTYQVVENELKALGYNVASQVLNSKNFGIPQNRERIFIVAWCAETLTSETFRFPLGLDESGSAIFERKQLDECVKRTSVADVLFDCDTIERIEKSSHRSYTLSEQLWMGHQRRLQQHRERGNGFGYSLYSAESPYTSTISARYYKDGSEILIDQSDCADRPDRPRKLHPIEAGRLQGFPVDTWYEIPVSDAQAYKQFGNSVSVPVVKTLFQQVLKQLLHA